ncbi:MULTISPECIES: hypothetical protein [Pseudomonas aeruginosa group]|uniref:Morphogenetic protein n=1 Tax=Pseudomonas nitroreducens TaxID=46680 RepID=A0A6G6IUU8_PSENT|nr:MULTISPECIES: hypothetical protein [Pseudomonas aeruginosa group]QIE86976.1 hypothetical protein G5B91_12155 [Pseudomonas nitroreducens]
MSPRENPILFNGGMVRAILDGRKRVTRRLVKPAFPASVTEVLPYAGSPEAWMPARPGEPESPWEEQTRLCPYGKPGDRLWVREAWVADAQVDSIAPRDLSQGEPIWYPADGSIRQTGCAMVSKGKGRPSIHMPRWASRILLEVTAVRVERLHDINEEQAQAEGIIPHCRGGWHWHRHNPQDLDDWHQFGYVTARRAFQDLWTSTGGDWDANPWVWVIEFKLLEGRA